jgi:hypothetical protein
MLPRPCAPGVGVEVPGRGDALAAGGLGAVVPGDVSRSAPCAELPVLDPVADDAGAAAQSAGGLGDADLAMAAAGRARDVVGVADPLHGLDVERATVPGDQPGGVQLLGQLGVGVTGPSRRTISTAGDGLRLAVPGWMARATQGRQRLGGVQCLLGLGEGGEPGPPACFQGTGRPAGSPARPG